jgi:hypothetical protein
VNTFPNIRRQLDDPDFPFLEDGRLPENVGNLSTAGGFGQVLELLAAVRPLTKCHLDSLGVWLRQREKLKAFPEVRAAWNLLQAAMWLQRKAQLELALLDKVRREELAECEQGPGAATS